MRKNLVLLSVLLVLFVVSCNKDEISDKLYWETDNHFTGDQKGSYTLTVDTLTYTDLDSDIALAAKRLAFVLKVHDSLDIVFNLSNVPEVDKENYIGKNGDSCLFQLTPKENGMELSPEEVIKYSFVATSGTIKRTAKDRVQISAKMKDDEGVFDRNLEADIYIGIITLDAK